MEKRAKKYFISTLSAIELYRYYRKVLLQMAKLNKKLTKDEWLYAYTDLIPDRPMSRVNKIKDCLILRDMIIKEAQYRYGPSFIRFSHFIEK